MSTIGISPDESTPRQFKVGSIPSVKSLSTTPTKLSKPTSEYAPGEWSFAMPHWIDISFWTGTADEQAMLLKQRKGSSRTSQEQKLKDCQFDLRCRMYELQMMGVMENEMTNIAIQHLHDNPLHPWQKIRPYIGSRSLSEKDRLRISKLERDWMDEYDENVFRTLHQRQAAEARAREEARNANLQTNNSTHDPFGATDSLYRDTGLTSGASSYRPGIGYLDWKMKERTPARGPSTIRKPSIASSLSTAESTASKTARFSRQISLGMSSIATPKAVVSLDITTASI